MHRRQPTQDCSKRKKESNKKDKIKWFDVMMMTILTKKRYSIPFASISPTMASSSTKTPPLILLHSLYLSCVIKWGKCFLFLFCGQEWKKSKRNSLSKSERTVENECLECKDVWSTDTHAATVVIIIIIVLCCVCSFIT